MKKWYIFEESKFFGAFFTCADPKSWTDAEIWTGEDGKEEEDEHEECCKCDTITEISSNHWLQRALLTSFLLVAIATGIVCQRNCRKCKKLGVSKSGETRKTDENKAWGSDGVGEYIDGDIA